MKCLELTRNFYFECVLKLMEKYFPELAKKHSAALIGWGSEVLENDDELSKFYGWGPKPKIFLSNKDYLESGKKLLEIFENELPLFYKNHPVRFKIDLNDGLPKVTDQKDGFLLISISTIEHLNKFYLGELSTPCSDFEWLLIPEQKLLELTSGEVFYDGLGTLNNFRTNLKYYPINVWKYKLTYQWTTLIWQLDLIGLCKKRGDILSARLCINETIKRIINLVFLLNKTYKPGYIKWVHRQFYKLSDLSHEIGSEIEKILTEKECDIALANINQIIELLIEYQIDENIISRINYKESQSVSRGFSIFNLDAIVKEIKKSINGELSKISFPVGSVDQWITDEDLLLSPNVIKNVRSVYFAQEPERNHLGDKEL